MKQFLNKKFHSWIMLCVDQSINQSLIRLNIQDTNQSINHSHSQSINQSSNHTVNQSINRTIDRPIYQATKINLKADWIGKIPYLDGMHKARFFITDAGHEKKGKRGVIYADPVGGHFIGQLKCRDHVTPSTKGWRNKKRPKIWGNCAIFS